MLKQLLARFFRPRIILAVPPGITPDASAANVSSYALQSNMNAYAASEANVTTAGTDTTLTAAQAVAGALILAAGASGGFTLTLPSTTALITALGPTIPKNGTFSKKIQIKNNNIGQTATLTAGDVSTTITGTATIATNTTRTFLLTVESATTVTIENLGTMNL